MNKNLFVIFKIPQSKRERKRKKRPTKTSTTADLVTIKAEFFTANHPFVICSAAGDSC